MKVGDLRLFDLKVGLLTIKGNKFKDINLSYEVGKLRVKGTRNNESFSQLIDINEIEELTVRAFYDYLVNK